MELTSLARSVSDVDVPDNDSSSKMYTIATNKVFDLTMIEEKLKLLSGINKKGILRSLAILRVSLESLRVMEVARYAK